MPVFQECQRCTACCRWPGQVRLTADEIENLADFKKISEYDFIQQYMRLTQDRRGLALMEKPDGACIFLEDNLCAVQSVKPQQCRDFPNLWNFSGAEKMCQAIPHDVSDAEFVRRVTEETGHSLEAIYSMLKREAANASNLSK